MTQVQGRFFLEEFQGRPKKKKKGLRLHNRLKQLKDVQAHEEMKKKTNSLSLFLYFFLFPSSLINLVVF